MKKFRKTLALLLAIISIATTMFGFSIQASALTVSSKYPTQNIKGYTLSSAAKSAVVYSDSGLTKSIGYAYGSDDCTIEKIYTNNVVKIRVPWSGYAAPGRTCYARLSDFWSTSYSVKILTVKTKTTCYTRKDLKTAKGSAWVNDRCFIVGEYGNYYQALVPWETGCYRICWLNKSAFAHTHTYSSGVEALHPHKVYNKCSSCGYYYYTGATKKLSSCTVCYPTNNTSFIPVWPTSAYYISVMGYYWNNGNPKSHGTRSNKWNAIDIAGSSGTSIYATEAGTVTEAGWSNSGFGYYVVIEHKNGLCSLYGHLKSSPIVGKGQTVKKNQTIGYMGSTGNSSGTHLHFEVYNKSNYSQVINPFVKFFQDNSSLTYKLTIGGNSYKANNYFYNSDTNARNWVNWLSNYCKRNSSGDYVRK